MAPIIARSRLLPTSRSNPYNRSRNCIIEFKFESLIYVSRNIIKLITNETNLLLIISQV